MKVYIVTNIAFPNGMAPGNRIKCYAGALASAGVDCEVIVYRRTERYGTMPQNTDGEGIVYGVHYHYIGGTPLRGSNVLIRRYHDLADKQKLKRYLQKNLKIGDVLFAYAGMDVDFNIILARQAHRQGAKYVRDLCELPYGTMAETPKAVKKRRKTEEKLLPLCDGIIPISDALKNYARQYAQSCSMLKLPILVDYDNYFLPNRTAETVIPFLFHSGTLTEQKDGILGMIEAFALAANELPFPVMMICTGKKESSFHAGEIDALIQRYRLEEKLLFTGYLNDEDLRTYLSRASLVVINKHVNQQNTYCFSTKLGEYMAAGKPIIITRVGEAMNWLKNGIDAVFIEPEDTQALKQAIKELFLNAEQRSSLGDNARITCKEHFDYHVHGHEMKQFFEAI